MAETSPHRTNALWFLAGCIAAAVVFYGLVVPEVRKSGTNDETFSKNLQTVQASLQRVTTERDTMQSNLQGVTKERDTCNAKFARSTFLYDVGLFNNETRAWVIPADVEPVIGPNKFGTYSHYDPKTQTETVHFKGKAQ
jgi:hypothetical protein